MSKFKRLDDVIGYLTNVAEFELRHTEHIKIPDGHMTVISENYNTMFDAIQWITEKLEQPTLNENQRQVLGWLKTGHCDGDSVFEALERITYVYEDPKTEEALESLSPDQEVQVINSFMDWVLEQEVAE